MATADSRPPKVVLQSITTQAERVRRAAAELTKRIEQFQEWLGNLPGRVETDYYGEHPYANDAEDNAMMSLVIRLHRDGKKWILSHATQDERWSHTESGGLTEFKPLVDAPLKTKIAAVKMFPNILAAIEQSQMKLVAELEAATSEYDAFAATISTTQPNLQKTPPGVGFVRRNSQGNFVESDNASSELSKKEGK